MNRGEGGAHSPPIVLSPRISPLQAGMTGKESEIGPFRKAGKRGTAVSAARPPRKPLIPVDAPHDGEFRGKIMDPYVQMIEQRRKSSPGCKPQGRHPEQQKTEKVHAVPEMPEDPLPHKRQLPAGIVEMVRPSARLKVKYLPTEYRRQVPGTSAARARSLSAGRFALRVPWFAMARKITEIPRRHPMTAKRKA